QADVEAQLAAMLGKNHNIKRRQTLSYDAAGALFNMIRWDSTDHLRARFGDSGAIEYAIETERTRYVRPLWVFPAFEQKADRDQASTELLWRLYDSKRERTADGSTYERQRVLWRLFHREMLGARTSVDVFPFIAYDRDTDLLQWSFMGGLVGWRR